MQLRPAHIVGSFILIAGGAGVLSLARRRSVSLADEHVSAPAEWCPPGFVGIVGDGCFAAGTGVARGLVVYLHGRYAPGAEDEERQRQTRVASVGARLGYAVLALRGAQRQCTSAEYTDWWCWPSNERNVSDGPAFIERARRALTEAERRAFPASSTGSEARGRRLLFGFSNGGYFASAIASRGWLSFDAIVIAHAGPVPPMHPSGKKPPILLIDADDDASGPEMDRLDDALEEAAWPHARVVREGGHALPAWDVEQAFTFFERTRTEALPFAVPLSARTARLPPSPPPEPQNLTPTDADTSDSSAPSVSEEAP
jgi:predicted esterase